MLQRARYDGDPENRKATTEALVQPKNLQPLAHTENNIR